MKPIHRLPLLVNAIALLAAALWFFLAPVTIIAFDLADPGLRHGAMPGFAYRWHRQLAPRFEDWATARLASGRAAELRLTDIAGTEWPLFSTVYFLWATEALQADWQADPDRSGPAPAEAARGAIEAAADLLVDPAQADWVRRHWGDDYLDRENLFYRMLLIAGLTSHRAMTGSDRHLALLQAQVIGLADELDRSPAGLLDDYPGQCYPIDVLPAIAVIQRSGLLDPARLPGFVDRARRGFSGSVLDPQTQLPAYVVDAESGEALGPARGVGASYMLIWAPELWPEQSNDWYGAMEAHYWQSNRWLAGVRELAAAADAPEWMVDVDAGPVIFGLGTAASAFAIAAARVNGRLDHAWPLSAQALALSWPLPNGTRLTPALLSDLTDAPLLGESALLFVLSRTPPDSQPIRTGGQLPWLVLIALFVYAAIGTRLLFVARQRLRQWRRGPVGHAIPAAALQSAIWIGLMVAAAAVWILGYGLPALGLLAVGLLLPLKGLGNSVNE